MSSRPTIVFIILCLLAHIAPRTSTVGVFPSANLFAPDLAAPRTPEWARRGGYFAAAQEDPGCNSADNCNGNAMLAMWNPVDETVCDCFCRNSWEGTTCATCSPIYNVSEDCAACAAHRGHYPTCDLGCNNADHCNNRAVNDPPGTPGTTGCPCECRNAWTGPSCTVCPLYVNQSLDCGQCWTNFTGYPHCARACEVVANCSAHASFVTGNTLTGCACECRGKWQGVECEICPGKWDPTVDCSACVPGYAGADCETPVCDVRSDCSNHAYAVVGQPGACTCTCRNSWTGSNCGICPEGMNATTDCDRCWAGFGPAYPMCTRLCNLTWCSGPNHATFVAGYEPGCACTCRNYFSGETCADCPALYNATLCDRCIDGYGGFPDCSPFCTVANCSNHATAASGTWNQGCACTCRNQWSGPECATCDPLYDASADCGACVSEYDNTTYPACYPLCTDAVDCRSRAESVKGNRYDGCTCKCRNGWIGSSCNTCPVGYIAAIDPLNNASIGCDRCDINYWGYPHCEPCPDGLSGWNCSLHICHVKVDCNDHADEVLGDPGNCTCVCRHSWYGATCDACPSNLNATLDCGTCANDFGPAYPVCVPKCTVAWCNGAAHATAVANYEPNCVCTCRNAWYGPTCALCAPLHNSTTNCDRCIDGYGDFPNCSPLCTIAADCTGRATAVSGTAASGCTCTCRNGWSSSDCSYCAPKYNVAPDCGTCAAGYDQSSYPNCYPLCTIAGNCNSRASSVTGNTHDGCNCSCLDAWGGNKCQNCPNHVDTSVDPGRPASVGCDRCDVDYWKYPNCVACDPGYVGFNCATRVCNVIADCSGHATSVSGSPGACVCNCRKQWIGAACNVCPVNYTAAQDCGTCAPSYGPNYPTCGPLCTAESCGGANQSVNVTGYEPNCNCACNNSWYGNRCQSCPPLYKRRFCESCINGYDGFPDCSPLCTKQDNCSNHATKVVGIWRQGCNCTCRNNWTSTDCSVCPPEYDADYDCTSCAVGRDPATYPKCWPLCTNATNCNNRAVTVSGNTHSGCSCTCRNKWYGTNCQSCPTGYDSSIDPNVTAWGCDRCSGDYFGYPNCKLLCTVDHDCSSHATNVTGYYPSCSCTCRNKWTGTSCASCDSVRFNAADDCGSCATLFSGYPNCDRPCDVNLDCSGHADSVSGTYVTGCTCVCRNQWSGSTCGSCATKYANDCGTCNTPSYGGTYPNCQRWCTNAIDCSGHAVNVSGFAGSCVCTCNPATYWYGAACQSCASKYDQTTCSSCASGYTRYPTCARICTINLDCTDGNHASAVSGDVELGCSCTCRGQYYGTACQSCNTALYINSPGYPYYYNCDVCVATREVYPACYVKCTNAANCNSHAAAVSGNIVQGCSCTCQYSWYGATCNMCPVQYNQATCSTCETGYGYGGYPTCKRYCTAALDCNNHATTVTGVIGVGAGCNCTCSNRWTGATCNTCSARWDTATCSTCRLPATAITTGFPYCYGSCALATCPAGSWLQGDDVTGCFCCALTTTAATTCTQVTLPITGTNVSTTTSEIIIVGRAAGALVATGGDDNNSSTSIAESSTGAETSTTNVETSTTSAETSTTSAEPSTTIVGDANTTTSTEEAAQPTTTDEWTSFTNVSSSTTENATVNATLPDNNTTATTSSTDPTTTSTTMGPTTTTAIPTTTTTRDPASYTCACAPGYPTSGNCTITGDTQCTMALDCTNRATAVSGTIFTGCSCTCASQWRGQYCTLCATNFTQNNCSACNAPTYSGTYPKCTLTCTVAANCSSHASKVTGNDATGCACTCTNAWKGAACNQCPWPLNNTTGNCNTCIPGYGNYPNCSRLCTAVANCTNHSTAVSGTDLTGCVCTCRNGWKGPDCGTCPEGFNETNDCGSCVEGYSGYPACATACTAANCTNRSVSVTGTALTGCTCKCRNNWTSVSACSACPMYYNASDDCGSCVEGYFKYPKCVRQCIIGNATYGDCTAGASNVTGDGTAGCVCKCRNKWTGTKCQTCPNNSTMAYNASDDCGSCAVNFTAGGYPTCRGVCKLDVHCNNHATNVTGDIVSGCKCTCRNGWTGANCQTCPAYGNASDDCGSCVTGFGGVPPTCARACSIVDDCNNHAVQAIGVITANTSCTCKCAGGWSGATCNFCAAQYNSSQNCMVCANAYSGVPPNCSQTCTNATDCTSHAAAVIGTYATGCTCQCLGMWTGAKCTACAAIYDATKQCSTCAAGYADYPLCYTACTVNVDCSGHAWNVTGNRVQGCKCLCKDQWKGTTCATCDAQYNAATCAACRTDLTGYPNCWRNCTNAVDCSNHAIAVTGQTQATTNGANCKCTCSGQFTGTNCGTCPSNYYYDGTYCSTCAVGYDTYPYCYKSCTILANCSNQAANVTGNIKTGCNCTCINRWYNKTCNMCPYGFDSTQNCGTCAATFSGYPNCSRACTTVNDCSSHAYAVTGETWKGCTCNCRNMWTGSKCEFCATQFDYSKDCAACAPGFTGSFPTCSRPCTTLQDCSARATSVWGDWTDCKCACYNRFQPPRCAYCPWPYTGNLCNKCISSNSGTYPDCFPRCSVAGNCSGNANGVNTISLPAASNISGNGGTPYNVTCDCGCRNGWSGPDCSYCNTTVNNITNDCKSMSGPTETVPLTESHTLSVSPGLTATREPTATLEPTRTRTRTASKLPVIGTTLDVRNAIVGPVTVDSATMVVNTSAQIYIADWVKQSLLPLEEVVVEVTLDTTDGGAHYGPSPKSNCIVEPGGIPCSPLYATGYGPAQCTLPSMAVPTESFTILCTFTLPSYAAITLGPSLITYNASCPKCFASAVTNVTLNNSAKAETPARVASVLRSGAFTVACPGDASSALALFPVLAIAAVVCVVVRGAHLASVLYRARPTRNDATSGSAQSGSDANRSFGSDVAKAPGQPSSAAARSGTSRQSSVVVVQGPMESPANGLIPLHAWVGLVLPFHPRTGVQQAAIFAAQVVTIGGIAAVIMEGAGVNDSDGAGALGTSHTTLALVVALGSPLAAAVLIRTPLHLLLMWSRIRDRRRHYVKTFDVGSERYAVRHMDAATWTTTVAPKEARRRQSIASDSHQDASAKGDSGLWTPKSNDEAPAAATPTSSSRRDDTAAAAVKDAHGFDAPDLMRHTARRPSRMPTHATHVRVAAARSTATAMVLAFVLFAASVVAALVVTKGWCAEAQRRYNVALAAALGVDLLVMSPAWVGILWAYRAVMAEPRVVALLNRRGNRSSSAAPSPQAASVGEVDRGDAATPESQPPRPATHGIKAQVLHEPYPIHNAWRVADITS